MKPISTDNIASGPVEPLSSGSHRVVPSGRPGDNILFPERLLPSADARNTRILSIPRTSGNSSMPGAETTMAHTLSFPGQQLARDTPFALQIPPTPRFRVMSLPFPLSRTSEQSSQPISANRTSKMLTTSAVRLQLKNLFSRQSRPSTGTWRMRTG